MCVIRCSQKCHVSLLLALLGFWCSVSFTNLFSLPILFFVSVFLFFLQLKNALLILTSTFLFQSQLAWHLASLSFLSLYLISSEEEKVVLAISLYNLSITSLLPPLCSSVPLKTCPFKNKQNVHSFFFFLLKTKKHHNKIIWHEMNWKFTWSYRVVFGESVLRTTEVSGVTSVRVRDVTDYRWHWETFLPLFSPFIWDNF